MSAAVNLGVQNIANRCRTHRDHDSFLRRFDIDNPKAEKKLSRRLTAEMFSGYDATLKASHATTFPGSAFMKISGSKA